MSSVFDKLAMSAFEGTPLQFALRDRGITTLAICGIALEIGIQPTVRHAADLGIRTGSHRGRLRRRQSRKRDSNP